MISDIEKKKAARTALEESCTEYWESFTSWDSAADLCTKINPHIT